MATAMAPQLGEFLYWAACWIAATVALLGLAAWLTGSRESWVGVTTFVVVAVVIWVIGRVTLWLSAMKQARSRRR
jgi:hypothetical protein